MKAKIERKDFATLEPDEHMRWIYDNNHPDYHTPRAEHLRDARAYALRHAPNWMIRCAELTEKKV